jgi:ribonuclease P protein component
MTLREGLLLVRSEGVRMKKEYRIKENKDFQQVFKKGHSTANRQFIVYVLKKEGQTNFRIGLSVSKKIGNAVVRNQVKRYIRQSVFEVKDGLANGFDYVIIARKPVADMAFFEVKKSLVHVLKLAKVLKRDYSYEKK